jgi:hypothetical protein
MSHRQYQMTLLRWVRFAHDRSKEDKGLVAVEKELVQEILSKMVPQQYGKRQA